MIAVYYQRAYLLIKELKKLIRIILVQTAQQPLAAPLQA